MTLRLVYLPRPKPSWRLPSLAAAMAQTFSVQAWSLVPTLAKVSTTWWVKPSSAAVSAPIGLVTVSPWSSWHAWAAAGETSSPHRPPPTPFRPGRYGAAMTAPAPSPEPIDPTVLDTDEEPGRRRSRQRLGATMIFMGALHFVV